MIFVEHSFGSYVRIWKRPETLCTQYQYKINSRVKHKRSCDFYSPGLGGTFPLDKKRYNGIIFYIYLSQKSEKWQGDKTLENWINLSAEDWVDLIVELKNVTGQDLHQFDAIFKHFKINMFGVFKTQHTLSQKKYKFESMLEYDLLAYFHFHDQTKNILTMRVKIEDKFYTWEGLVRLTKENPGCVISVSIGIIPSDITVINVGSKINGTLKLFFFKSHNKKLFFYKNAVKTSKISYKGRYTYMFNCSDLLKYLIKRHNEHKYYYVLSQIKCNLRPVDKVHPWTVVFLGKKYFEAKNSLKGTWNEASEFCKSLGGYLPIIRSREEQDELVSLLRLSLRESDVFRKSNWHRTIHHQVVFIGLSTNQKVSILLNERP